MAWSPAIHLLTELHALHQLGLALPEQGMLVSCTVWGQSLSRHSTKAPEESKAISSAEICSSVPDYGRLPSVELSNEALKLDFGWKQFVQHLLREELWFKPKGKTILLPPQSFGFHLVLQHVH